jgi:ParB family chromosome partitioning protein
MMYRRALDERLFSTQEQLAKELGVDAGNLSKALKLAMLDKRIVEAFASPLDLQYRWAKPLMDALSRDAAGVLARAAELKNNGVGTLSPRDVFEALVGQEPKETDAVAVVVDGITKAMFTRRGDEVAIRFDKGVLNSKKLKELEEVLSEWLRE